MLSLISRSGGIDENVLEQIQNLYGYYNDENIDKNIDKYFQNDNKNCDENKNSSDNDISSNNKNDTDNDKFIVIDDDTIKDCIQYEKNKNHQINKNNLNNLNCYNDKHIDMISGSGISSSSSPRSTNLNGNDNISKNCEVQNSATSKFFELNSLIIAILRFLLG